MWDAALRALSEIVSTARPYLHHSLSQRADKNEKKRNKQWGSEFVKLVDTDRRNDADAGAFVVSICEQAGYPAGNMGENISVPVGVIHALILIASRKIKQDYLLNHIQFREDK